MPLLSKDFHHSGPNFPAVSENFHFRVVWEEKTTFNEKCKYAPNMYLNENLS